MVEQGHHGEAIFDNIGEIEGYYDRATGIYVSWQSKAKWVRKYKGWSISMSAYKAVEKKGCKTVVIKVTDDEKLRLKTPFSNFGGNGQTINLDPAYGDKRLVPDKFWAKVDKKQLTLDIIDTISMF